ncbi:MAG: thermonuclease family protein [Candidatus Marinamargulisbacteria bacterium]
MNGGFYATLLSEMLRYFLVCLVSVYVVAEPMAVTVIRVVDGDTIHVKTPEGDRKKVRLWGIDAPELTQKDGAVAGRFLASLIGGESVILHVVDTDEYGRLVAKVTDAQGRFVNEEMIKMGLAWVYWYYVKDTQPKWGALAANAKTKKWGIWRRGIPVEPWRHRQARRKQNQPSP